MERSASPGAAAAPPEKATRAATSTPSTSAAVPTSRGAFERGFASSMRIYVPPWLGCLLRRAPTSRIGLRPSSNWFEPVGAGYGGGTTGRNRDVPPALKEGGENPCPSSRF